LSAAPKLRVLYLAAGYVRSAGIEVYLLHYATELRQHGFETGLAVFEPLPRREHRCLRELRQRGIPIRSLGDGSPVWPGVYGAIRWALWAINAAARGRRIVPPAHFVRRELKRRQLSRLARLLRRDRPDIVHVKGRLIAEAWALLPAERTVLHIATAGQRDSSWSDREAAEFAAFAQRAARVFAPGRGVAVRLKEDFGIHRQIDVIFTMAPDEAPESALCPAAGGRGDASGVSTLRFGFLGRLHENKGLGHIVEALVQFKQQGKEKPFTFAGEGPYENDLRAAIAEQGLGLAEIVSVRTPADALSRVDVLVLPSFSEAMPLAIVEAFMCGIPCIATRVGGIPDLVRDGVEGLFIESRAAGPIVDAMEKFTRMSPGEFQGFKKRARERYEAACRPDAVSSVVAEHYRRILEEVPQS